MLNGATINGSAAIVFAPPSYVVPGIGYTWQLRVIVDGVDLSAQVLGSTDIDREGGAAGVGGLELYLPPGPVVPTDWIGRSVTIDFLWWVGVSAYEERRYSGQILRPRWNAADRVLSCELSDNLQQRVESMDVAAIDTLTGGAWSPDVFQPVEGRSRWDYAMERMGTQTASLDCSPYGYMRVSSWYATPVAQYVFGTGTTLDGTLSLDLPDLSRMTNQVVIEADYRYTRFRQKNEKWSWFGGIFCSWYFTATKELPTISMVEEAVAASGSFMIGTPEYEVLPPSAFDPCGTGENWINYNTDLLLGVDFETGRRWAQPVTEKYELTLECLPSIMQAGEIVARIGGRFEVESPNAEAWASEPFSTGTSGHTDDRDEPRRLAFFGVLLAQGLATIVSAHRGTRVTFALPTPMASGIDLIHTVRLDDQGIIAQGRVVRVRDVYDHAAGTAITMLDLAIMRGGGGASDPLVPPPSVDEPQPPAPVVIDLPTQLGRSFEAECPVYDDDLPGFAGNYTIGSCPEFPRRFDIVVPEIPEDKRNELPVPVVSACRVAVPDDDLEL
jgi:hypothetical protein